MEKKIFSLKNLILAGIVVVAAKNAYDYLKTTKTYSDISKKVKEKTEPKVMRVKKKIWQESITVEKLVEVTKTGWHVPDGAYDVRTERRPRNSEKVTIGEVSIPLEKTDIYYIYKKKEWQVVDTFLFAREGQFSDAESLKFQDDINERISKNNDSTDVDLDPAIGDCRISRISYKYRIIGSDKKTGETVEAEVDKFFHDDVSIGDVYGYKKTFGGDIKILTTHIVPMTFGDDNDEAGDC